MPVEACHDRRLYSGLSYPPDGLCRDCLPDQAVRFWSYEESVLLVNWKELNERTPTGSTSTWSPSRLGDARCEGCQGKDGPCNGYLCDGCGRCEWNCLCEEHDGQFSDRGKRIIPAQLYEW